MARLVAWLLPPDLAWVLTLDRTHWTLGRAQIKRPQFSFFRYGLDGLHRLVAYRATFADPFVRLLGLLLDGRLLDLHPSIDCDRRPLWP